MRETLDAALADLFGSGTTVRPPTEIAAGASPPPPAAGATDRDALVAEARGRYQAALEAQAQANPYASQQPTYGFPVVQQSQAQSPQQTYPAHPPAEPTAIPLGVPPPQR